MKTIQTKGKKDATIRLEMEQQILGIRRRGGYTKDEALDLVVPPEENGDRCLHCYRIFQKAWVSLIRKGWIERVA